MANDNPCRESESWHIDYFNINPERIATPNPKFLMYRGIIQFMLEHGVYSEKKAFCVCIGFSEAWLSSHELDPWALGVRFPYARL